MSESAINFPACITGLGQSLSYGNHTWPCFLWTYIRHSTHSPQLPAAVSNPQSASTLCHSQILQTFTALLIPVTKSDLPSQPNACANAPAQSLTADLMKCLELLAVDMSCSDSQLNDAIPHVVARESGAILTTT